jgi:alpha-L-fucosidase 2
MKKIITLALVALPLALACLCSCTPDGLDIDARQLEMKWWYDTPATKYWEGLPIGTGRFGAMIPGAIDHEVIAFNDETLWTGGPYNPNNPEGPQILEKVREYAFQKNWLAAHNEAYKLASDPQAVQRYQPMGRLNLTMHGHDPAAATDYTRTLSMDDALVTVSYSIDGTKYSRQVFASYPDQVIVVRLTADRKGKIDIDSRLSSLQPSAQTTATGNTITMRGTTISDPGRNHDMRILPPQMRWQSQVHVLNEGGTLTTSGDKITIEGADSVTLILAGATNWVRWNDVSADERQRCEEYLAGASTHTYTQLLQRHLDDYRPLFASLRLNLGPDPDPTMTTTQSMERQRAGADDPAYAARYFQYGRYLMLAGARENTLAFNNHNMWLDNLEGRWQGRWTHNINIQECYWPVESTGLPRINESLLLFVENLAESGARTARELYGCGGWCAHHGTDVWFNTAPTDGNPLHATWPMAGVWLMQQLYDHYLYNPDTEYLRRIYPLMKGAAQFCLDFMAEEPVTGNKYMVTIPATSPENYFFDDEGNRCAVSFGSSGDNQMVRKLFRDCVEAFTILGTDDDMVRRMNGIIPRIPPHQTGALGQLQEWIFDFAEVEPTHRHVSHLYAVYPDDDISLRRTPELIDAVRVTLDRRGGDINRGWSGAWKINIHARLEEPDKAYDILRQMLTDVSLHPRPDDSTITPSFEGNQAIQGVTAGITEMLMQSHSGELSLLPALPAQWSNGAIEGLRARGGFKVGIEWKEGKLTRAIIHSTHGNPCTLRTASPVKVTSAGSEVELLPSETDTLKFSTVAGQIYTVESIAG